MQRAAAAALIAAGNTAVADSAQPWGDPTSEDDLKLFGNFGHRYANGLQLYGTLGADERAQLVSEGVASARTLAFFRFFINDFSTRTRGVDVVSTWAPPGRAAPPSSASR